MWLSLAHHRIWWFPHHFHLSVGEPGTPPPLFFFLLCLGTCQSCMCTGPGSNTYLFWILFCNIGTSEKVQKARSNEHRKIFKSKTKADCICPRSDLHTNRMVIKTNAHSIPPLCLFFELCADTFGVTVRVTALGKWGRDIMYLGEIVLHNGFKKRNEHSWKYGVNRILCFLGLVFI